MEEAKTIYKEVLETPFDYNEKESIDIDYDELPFAASKKDLKERWRQQLKYATLGTYDSKVRKVTKEAEVEKSAEKDEVTEAESEEDPDDHDEPMTPGEAEVSARESTKKTLDEFFDFVSDLERKDWFVQYINTIVDEFDPHTYYFARMIRRSSI